MTVQDINTIADVFAKREGHGGLLAVTEEQREYYQAQAREALKTLGDTVCPPGPPPSPIYQAFPKHILEFDHLTCDTCEGVAFTVASDVSNGKLNIYCLGCKKWSEHPLTEETK